MGSTFGRFGAAVALALGAIAVPAVATAAPGPGTFTKISTPSHTLTYHWVDGAANHLHISGTTSNDVTSVDLICVYLQPTGNPSVTTLANAVPVTAGSFGRTVTIPQLIVNCRLRALPTGEPTTGYLGAYAGPIMYMWGAETMKDAGTPYAWTGVGENTALIGIAGSAGQCGTDAIAALPSPSLRLESALIACFEALPAGNVTSSGTPNASSVKIDGHNAYVPSVVHGWRQTPQSLTVTQTALSVSATRNSAGDITFVDREPFVRCSVSDAYPPTTASCPAMVATGVTLVRTLSWIRSGHQFKVRDSFVSSGAAHNVAVQYNAQVQPPSRGNVGYSFPGRPVAFGPGSPNTSVSGFGKGAHTLLVRSDLHAAPDDPSADTVGFTWSRPPAFKFGNDPNVLAMTYNLPVPAHSAAYLGFAYSQNTQVSSVQSLARAAQTDMMPNPRITSPANGAHLAGTSTTVKGTLAIGANGLPKSVKVNGHNATITRTSSTTAKFAVTFSESAGSHKITAVATDNGGNVRSTHISVTNG
jgi:hypothetical protein